MTEIPDGPDFEGSPEESNFVKAAAGEVNKLIKANRVNRWVIQLLAVISVVLMVVVVGLGVGVWELHKQNVDSCNSGNSFRAGNTQIWNDFIGLLITSKTPKSVVSIADGFLKNDVGQIDAPRSCGSFWP